MADLRAQDIGIIIVSLVVVVCVRAAYAYRAEIGMIVASLWRRYIAVDDWRAAMDRLADQRDGVRDSQDRPLSYMSSRELWEEDDRPVAGVLQQNNNAATTDCNAAQSNNALLQHQAATLAKLVKAGVVGETKGLQIVFDVKPSSTSTKYQEARDALKAELAKLDPPAVPTPIAGRPTRAVFHQDESGI